MEVSSPPTIRSFVCDPHRPGRGRSDSLNPCRCGVDEGLEKEVTWLNDVNDGLEKEGDDVSVDELSDEQQT